MIAEPSSFPDLIRKLRNGDSQAAAELLRLYEPEVRRLIRLSLTDSALRRVYESADIFQSVFAAFYVRLLGGQYDLEEPWQLIQLLATMARNKIIDHARRHTNQPIAQTAELIANIEGREETPSAIVANEELMRRVLGLLTEDERRLAEQRAAGRSWQELAKERASTADAVRKRVKRALDRISEELGFA